MKVYQKINPMLHKIMLDVDWGGLWRSGWQNDGEAAGFLKEIPDVKKVIIFSKIQLAERIL